MSTHNYINLPLPLTLTHLPNSSHRGEIPCTLKTIAKGRGKPDVRFLFSPSPLRGEGRGEGEFEFLEVP
jgi:hypothetical protein